MIKKYFFALVLISISILLNAQETNPTDTEAVRKNSINLFIDCGNCDIEHFKNEITFVNYVRDRKESDVQIIITEMGTGSGGTEFTLTFYGHNKFEGFNDTLSFPLPANYTDDEKRTAQINMIKLGLVSYVAKTPMGKNLSVVYDNPNKDEEEKIVEDKWKSWVFESNISGYSNGDDVYNNNNLWTRFNISKVTPDIKIEFSYNNNYSESIYRLTDDTIKTYTNSNYISLLTVKSINEHWSYGGFANVYGNSYSNIDLGVSIAPAIEYNLFKYSEATTKQLRFLYRAGYKRMNYIDTTIYDKTEENLFYQHLSINFEYVKQWGSIGCSLYGQSYFHDFSKNNVGINLSTDIRLFKGLSLRVSGGYSQNRDQLALRKEETSTEDILLRQKEVATNYHFWASYGLTYTFGSIYNNVVNPRFD
jgi:hypothetical protein